ncbi:hypothetical protein [Rheinheimera hassiensis]|uniref:hypothetical protein n=1 Tax=Rheinheimera hassiensis TaxID=1193627 RepID=UPI001F064E1C|nr:hypothetical protein [Rheinheimera hassiensis]
MFEKFAQLVQDASLLGLNMTFKPMGKENFSVILSFMAAPITDQGVYSECKDDSDNIDAVLALRSALAVPLVVTGQPAELAQKLADALTTVKSAVVEANTTFNAIDISALLKVSSTKAATATKAVKPAEAKPANNAKPEQADTAVATGADNDVFDDEMSANTGSDVAQASAATPDFNDFDSL